MTVLITVFILFFSNVLDVKAACPQGWDSDTIQAMYSYNFNGYQFSCYFTIIYCCRWNNDLKQVQAIIDVIYPTYSSICWLFIRDWWDFNNWVHNTVAVASISCSPPYPPCDDPNTNYFEIKVIANHCWYYENIQKYIGDDYILMKKRCGNLTNYCEITWRVCIDYSQNPPRISRTLVSRNSIGQPQCPDTYPELPPDDDPRWGQYWITQCFAHPCN